METKNEKLITVVRELAEFVNDGILGYQKGFDSSKDDDIRNFCKERLIERKQSLDELNNIISKNGGSPENSGTIKGSIYRQWMGVKSSLTGSDYDSIIDYCLYGEEWAMKAYDDAIISNIPLDVVKKLEIQKQECKHAYNELVEMKSYHN